MMRNIKIKLRFLEVESSLSVSRQFVLFLSSSFHLITLSILMSIDILRSHFRPTKPTIT